ncbi:hypothetical protein EXIGLDRAFT_441866 [Exidia glandulosa HHB12029]|uniref:Uncharacterized protein n=1 Tax=Exidia glandulosa HHB12029 TaxID=1314781 RepID=A0A165KBA5_EXIGL|nr:hypothetical protein EXIGLDRAFT_441866 [Exidia glandulosa HHB12029]
MGLLGARDRDSHACSVAAPFGMLPTLRCNHSRCLLPNPGAWISTPQRSICANLARRGHRHEQPQAALSSISSATLSESPDDPEVILPAQRCILILLIRTAVPSLHWFRRVLVRTIRPSTLFLLSLLPQQWFKAAVHVRRVYGMDIRQCLEARSTTAQEDVPFQSLQSRACSPPRARLPRCRPGRQGRSMCSRVLVPFRARGHQLAPERHHPGQ